MVSTHRDGPALAQVHGASAGMGAAISVMNRVATERSFAGRFLQPPVALWHRVEDVTRLLLAIAQRAGGEAGCAARPRGRSANQCAHIARPAPPSPLADRRFWVQGR